MKAYCKVLILFNVKEDEDDLESNEETLLHEKDFETYWDMRNYVTDCVANGAVGGMVFKRGHGIVCDHWVYYMDVI